MKLKPLIKLKFLYIAYESLRNDSVWRLGCFSKDDSQILVL
jgi:hypothetical protein